MTTPTEELSADEISEAVAAYRNGYGELAYDKPHFGQPIHTHDIQGEPVDYLQFTYRGEPAWGCQECAKVVLGTNPDTCPNCGAVDVLGALLHGPVRCRTVAGVDVPCLIDGSDGCQCPEEDPR